MCVAERPYDSTHYREGSFEDINEGHFRFGAWIGGNHISSESANSLPELAGVVPPVEAPYSYRGCQATDAPNCPDR